MGAYYHYHQWISQNLEPLGFIILNGAVIANDGKSPTASSAPMVRHVQTLYDYI